MQLNQIEKTVISYFLSHKGVVIDDLDEFFIDLSTSDREMTGVGFITDLNRSNKLKVGEDSESYKWGDLGIMLNSSTDTGYLLYVKDGYLDAIEGYTYGECWPENIEQIDVHAI